VNVRVLTQARRRVVLGVLLVADGRGLRVVVLALPVLRQAVLVLPVPRADADRVVVRVDREDGDEEEEEELDGASVVVCARVVRVRVIELEREIG
jgi:hypothetical protein